MAFDACTVAIELAKTLRQPLEQLRRHDRELADQVLTPFVRKNTDELLQDEAITYGIAEGS
jgi:hypothetical protein